MIFKQMNYMMYTKLPTLNKGLDVNKMGVFTDYDDFDILILFDILIFTAN
jgi:hypothetical protein